MIPWSAATTLAYKQSVPRRKMAEVTRSSPSHDVLTYRLPTRCRIASDLEQIGLFVINKSE